MSESEKGNDPAAGGNKPAANNKDSMRNIILVSLMVCFACSVVVSSAAVFLKPERIANKLLDRNKNILETAGLYNKETDASADVDQLFSQFEVRVVDLEEKRMLSVVEAKDRGIEAATYDQRKASKDPSRSKALGDAEDVASITRRARYSTVYILRDEGEISKLVLPIHGYGLWSTLYGYIALEPDMNTVAGITFYEHGETAGLGGEVDNPDWKSLWHGKEIYRDGRVALDVIKGSVPPETSNPEHKIDGLSGATLTSQGVENIIAYWMGEDGFGPILKDIRG
ncbi:MAG: Na(+)-translocating NADH-quinone reductase subunit C [Proteobacteria bacterium]|nr:Na(+)-translocating NADH-quinone reductase subunit C [Pseudomonadota bacterium]